MYSFQPLDPAVIVNVFAIVGSLIFAFVIGVFAYISLGGVPLVAMDPATAEELSPRNSIIFSVLIVFLSLGIYGVIEMTTRKVVHPNTKVVGTLEGFENQYVVYAVPEGKVRMLSKQNSVYPKEAILYKN